MSVNNKGSFVAWEEHIVCHERGRRVVHFYLKDDLGGLVLAVVGNERSIRHMLYVVSDEYLQAFGSDGVINSSTKWRSRREVVEWLTSMVSNEKLDNIDQSSEPFEVLVSGTALCMPNQKVNTLLEVPIWCGDSRICSKQLKHYPAFCWNGSTITVYSFVLIMSEENTLYVGYLEDMYEDKRGLKKVKVRWFFLNHVVNKIIPRLDLHPREVFITPHTQVISAEYILSLTTVLTPSHYEQCMATAPQDLAAGFYLCSRQLKNKKVKPFSLMKLRGYLTQSVLSSLGAANVENERVPVTLNGIDEGMSYDSFRQCVKRKGGAAEQQELNVYHFRSLSIRNPCGPQVKLQLSRKPSAEFVPSVGEKIELLCQDSGIRGCWFRCKVLKRSPKNLRIQYDDVQDVEGSGRLEEWVPASRVAAPDRLGMRCPGRHIIRPRRRKDSADCVFELGSAVDAWYCDGWWEGVVVKVNISGPDSLQVYLPGEGILLTSERTNVRISTDWFDNRWVDIKPKPEILRQLFLNFNSGVKLNASGCNNTSSQAQNIFAASKLEPIKEDETLAAEVVSDSVDGGKQTEDELGHPDNIVDIPIHDGSDINNDKEQEENAGEDMADVGRRRMEVKNRWEIW